MIEIDLRDILVSWKVEYGTPEYGPKGSKYYKIPFERRRELLEALIGEFVALGVGKDFFRSAKVRMAIAKECFPPIVRNKKSRRNGHDMVYREIDEIIKESFDDIPKTSPEEVVLVTHATELPEVYQDEEVEEPVGQLDQAVMDALEKPSVDSLEEPTKEVVDDIEDEKDSVEDLKRYQALTPYDPSKHGRLGKELNRDRFKDVPKPERIIDEWADELLGFKK